MAEKKSKEVSKDGALEEALKEIKKTYGDGAIMKLGERSKVDLDKEIFSKFCVGK